ncbi:MAG: hypothetical protein PWQ82_1227 [Thermosediminibacterales bacterium]|nr:hypothetical protein [Thermosediminibacterales bacterium]
MTPAVTEKDYRIHSYEVDYKKKALITSLMNYLDDIAILQSEELGVGLEYLTKNNIAWVLYKWDVKINQYPVYNENVKVRTAAESFNKFYAYRWFEVLNQNGDKLVTANSIWLLINTKKRKPIRIFKNLYDTYGVEDKKNTLEIMDIQPLTSIDVQKEFDVRYSDIDTNGHVNNVKYITWAMESVPVAILSNYSITGIKVTYKKETKYGDTVKTQTQVLSNGDKITSLHKIINKKNVDLCLLEIVWEKR